MQQFKNVALHPVDVGGRILASGEVAELSPHVHAVHEAVAGGHLLALVTFREAPAPARVPDDDDDDVKPVKKTSAPRQHAHRES